MNKVGILSIGGFIPKLRVQIEDIARANNKNFDDVKSLGVSEKTVSSSDEDATTHAVAASLNTIHSAPSPLLVEKIGAIFVGSESHSYDVKPTGTLVANMIGMGEDFFTADVEFACKGGTAAMQIVANFIKAGSCELGLAIGTDTGSGARGDALEYTASSGAAAILFADFKKYDCIAEILDTVSVTGDNPDFWRANGEIYPSHAGRFSAKSYENFTIRAIEKILKKTDMQISDFDHVVLHMPNGKLPKVVAKTLGVTDKQFETGFIVPFIGNTYSAQTLLGLASVLENAVPNQNILVCSYGSGAGSDAFVVRTTEHIKKFKPFDSVQAQIENKKIIPYVTN